MLMQLEAALEGRETTRRSCSSPRRVNHPRLRPLDGSELIELGVANC
jgi:hypothetical protein